MAVVNSKTPIWLNSFFAFFCLIQAHLCLAESDINVTPYPSWVTPQALPKTDNIPLDHIQNGVHYLLVDAQISVNPKQEPHYFYHYAEHIVNQAGVEGSSQLNLDYDPSYQQIVLHDLRIVRESKAIDKTKTALMKLIQREEDMDDLIYNGRTTLNIILDDVRIGDTIEYSYSIIGMNPVFQGIFAYRHNVNWAVPVEQLYLRLLWNKPSKLQYQLEKTNINVTHTNTTTGSEYVIQANHLPSIQIDEGAPSWFSPWGRVYFSELKSWGDVVNWSEELYTNAIKADGNINQLITDIKNKHPEKDAQISAALRFVQDEVRYLGIELGQNSHLPNAAHETLKNRYGDCKDKTVLLLTLLEGLGVEASPALVNTEEKLDNVLPSIHAFNHVITYMEHNDKGYWLDPTRTYQHGSIDTIHQPDFGHALILKTGSKDLTPMHPDQSMHGTFVKDTFTLSSEHGASFTSITDFYGWNAERERSRLEGQGRDKFQENYLEFFKSYYPSITTEKLIEHNERPLYNALTSTESYKIPDFWQESQDKQRIEGDFYPNLISPYLKVPDELERSHPLYLTHPLHLEQTITVNFEEDDWNFNNEYFAERNPFFTFTTDIKFIPENQQLILTYGYQSKTDTVLPEDYPEYLQALKNTANYKYFGIQRPIASGQTSTEATWYSAYLTPTYVIIAYLLLYVLILVLWLLDKDRKAKGDSIFYPVSATKLTIMWVLTFGFYGAFWFYRNFRYIKEIENNASMPVARGIFFSFWYYSLWQKLKEDCDERFTRSHLPSRSIVTVLAVAFFASIFVGNADVLMVPSLLVSAVLVLPLANYIQFVNGQDSASLKTNSKWKIRHILLAILSLPLCVLSVGSEIGFLPSESVIKGDKLWSSDITTMQRRGIINPGDTIEYFYSDAFLTIGDDGNGFTQRHVFSYWKNEDGSVEQQLADYSHIQDIQIQWNTEFAGNSIVTIVREDGSQFLLFVANAERKDKVFVKALKNHWKRNR